MYKRQPGDALGGGFDLWRYGEEVLHIRELEVTCLLYTSVTTHKIDLFAACREMFDFIDPYAQLCGDCLLYTSRCV